MSKSEHHPPIWADRLLNFFCRPDYADEILGDLTEAFYWRVEKKGLFKARSKFIWEVVKSLRPKNLKSVYHFSLNTMIFRNYIKIAFRTFLKRKSTSFINIFGLSIGVAAFALIFLYAWQILTFDDFHTKKDRIFLTYKERLTPDGMQPTYDTWVPMGKRLKNDYTQVVDAASIYTTEARIIKNQKYLQERIMYTDASFFNIFSFGVKYGNESSPFTNRESIVISQEMAVKYFAKDNPVGEDLEIFIPEEDTILRYQISAVMSDYPSNLSYQPDLIVQSESIPTYSRFENSWNSSFLETYVLLDYQASAAELESLFPELVESIWDAETRARTNFRLLPMEEYFDQFLGSKENARTLLLIGFGILLIGSINFMNLSTAQASRRTREIGLRKVLGAFKGQLRTQFVTEAFVSSVLATLLGLILVVILIPYFNDFFDVNIALTQFSILEIVAFGLVLTSLLGLLSGSYPAVYLSSIQAVDAMRQKMGFGGAVNFRNMLVIVQFSIALFLIASAIFVRNQIVFMTSRDMGFSPEGIVVISASRNDFVDSEQGMERLKTLRSQLKSKSYIHEVSLSRHVPTSWSGSFTFIQPDGWTGDPLRMRLTFVDANFFNTYNIPVKYGTNFLPDTEGDQRRSVVLNEAAFKAFGFSSGEGNVITNRSGNSKFNVVGVVEDFNFETLQNEVAPTMIFHRSASNPVHAFISCKMDMTNLPAKMEEIEAIWNQLGSVNDFTFSFMDENVEELYEAEKRYLGMVTMFSILSIIVACLGLYGLTLFVIEKRRKEISIRKVLGSETSGILRLIFKDFTRWVVISFVISVPFVIYFISDWLEGFHYRISVSWLTFAVTLVLVLGLVILTVGYQSLKAALSNPVRYLKEE